MKATMKFLLSRLREPSTLAGLSMLGVLVGLPPGTVDLACQALGAVAALGAVLVPE